MLIIRKLKIVLIFVAIGISVVFNGCVDKKTQSKTTVDVVEIDSAKEFYEQPEATVTYDYQRFAGIYDHESTARGFAAVLVITESGNDLSFTLSVAQGTCKGEVSGNMLMVSHEQHYYVGFFEANECPLQFTLQLTEDKIDVKEVNLCQLRDSNCSFEGNYQKRER